MSGFPARVRDLVAERSGLRCEGCGGPGPFQLHHRQYRSRGGPDTASNALSLCGLGNIDGCHGRAHTGEGERLGWSIRSGFKPANVLANLTHGLCLLTDDGRVIPQAPEEVKF